MLVTQIFLKAHVRRDKRQNMPNGKKTRRQKLAATEKKEYSHERAIKEKTTQTAKKQKNVEA